MHFGAIPTFANSLLEPDGGKMLADYPDNFLVRLRNDFGLHGAVQHVRVRLLVEEATVLVAGLFQRLR